jgi:hypothetical protein
MILRYVDTLFPQKLALTSLTSGGRESVSRLFIKLKLKKLKLNEQTSLRLQTSQPLHHRLNREPHITKHIIGGKQKYQGTTYIYQEIQLTRQ